MTSATVARRKKATPKPPKVLDGATQYAKDVVAGKVLVGRLVRLSCERHLADLKAGAKRGLVWDVTKAQEAITFFPEFLTLDTGQPFVLQPWQQFVVGSVFGWYLTSGTRRFRTAYIESGKGSGKTPMAAGVGLVGLVVDGLAGAEVYSAATGAKQAGIAFQDAKNMVERSPDLSETIDTNVGALSIPSQYASFKPVSSEHKGLDGKRVHLAIIDELHEHPNATVVDKMRAGTKKDPNALIFEITNSGFDRHSVCWQHHEYSVKVLEGIFPNDSWFSYVCALDEGDSWEDEAVWGKANPNLGVSLTVAYLREQVKEAQGMPSKQNIVRRLNFCEWTEQADRWIDVRIWDEVTQPIDEAELRGRDCFAGLDLASTTDLAALALLFPPTDDEFWRVVMRYWVPGDNIRERVERDRVPYDVWRDQGLLTATEGNVVDYDFIEAEIRTLAGQFQIRELAYDRFFAGQLVTHLQAEGLTMVPFGQGFVSMAAPCREFDALVRGRKLIHGGHPVLRWNVANLAIRQDPAGNQKPDKEKSMERIDGAVAVFDALGRAITHATPVGSGIDFL